MRIGRRPGSGDPTTLWPALALVRLAGLLVPAHRRSEWREEWESEIRCGGQADPGLAGGARLALRALGAFPDAFYIMREGWRMGGFVKEAALAARGLARRPGLTALIVATLGLGIGANTALFSIVHGVVTRPFPYPDADRVVAIQTYAADRPASMSGNVSYPNAHDWDRLVGGFSEIAAISWWRPALTLDDRTLVLPAGTVTANYFDVFGIPPEAGRFFRPDEMGSGREPAVVLSHRLWTEAFDSDPAVVGRTIDLNGTPYTVLGVVGAGFEDPGLLGQTDTPLVWRTTPTDPAEGFRSGRSWKAIGRVREGVSVETASDELAAVMASLTEQYPEENANRVTRIVPLRDLVAGPVRDALWMLMAAVGLVLLVTCANVAGLLAGRALDRRTEVAVRRALGASRRRLVGQFMTESAVLAGLGCALGLVLAFGGTSWVVRLAADSIPRAAGIGVSGPVLAFTLTVAAATAVLFGLAPALHAAGGPDGGPERARGAASGQRGGTLRRALVALELALSLVLLVGAGLMVRTFQALNRTDLGVTREGVVTMDLHGSAWWDLDPGEAEARYAGMFDRIAALPGVVGVGAIDYVPLGGNYSCDGFVPLDRPEPGPGEGSCVETRTVTGDVFGALGIPLLQGRLLDATDRADAPGAVVVSRQLAREFWPDVEVLGRQARIHSDTFTVVGVVGDVQHFGPGQEARPQVYMAAPQEPWNGITRGLTLVTRGDADVGSLATTVRQEVRAFSAAIPVDNVRTMERLVAENLAAPRFRATLLLAFGALALVLAGIGVAGVMGYSVRRRTREIGVRLALGARSDELVRMVLREGLALTAAGMALGLLGAVAAARLMGAFLFGVSAADPVVFLAVPSLLAAMAVVACWAPARRAARVNPVTALKGD